MEKLLIDLKHFSGAPHLIEPVQRFLLKNHDHYIAAGLNFFSTLECWRFDLQLSKVFNAVAARSALAVEGLGLSVQVSPLGYCMTSQYCW